MKPSEIDRPLYLEEKNFESQTKKLIADYKLHTFVGGMIVSEGFLFLLFSKFHNYEVPVVIKQVQPTDMTIQLQRIFDQMDIL